LQNLFFACGAEQREGLNHCDKTRAFNNEKIKKSTADIEKVSRKPDHF
jgi:hypothetical protein